MPMDLGESTPGPVIFRASTAATFHGQSALLEALEERPSGRVHGSSISQGLFGPRLYLGMAEFCRCLAAFLLVTWHTGQRQVGHTITAASRLWHNMFHFERHLVYATIGTRPLELLQQIRADFISTQFAVLVRTAADGWVHELLHIEPYQLHAE